MKVVLAIIALGVVSCAAAALWFGSDKVSTWNQVLRSDATAAIDRHLGEIRVKRAEAQTRVERLSVAMERLREGHVATEVRAEQLAKRIERTAALQARSEAGLRGLRDLIAARSEATLGGVTYSPQALSALGDRLASALEAVRSQHAALEQARAMLVESAARLNTRWEEGRAALGSLRDFLTIIDAKIESLTYLRVAAEVANAADGSLAGQFQRVQTDLDSLYGKVEAGLRIEEDRWKSDTLTGGPNVEPILRELNGGEELLLQRIDQLLGPSPRTAPPDVSTGGQP
jgi:chromosome segregation ATPase